MIYIKVKYCQEQKATLTWVYIQFGKKSHVQYNFSQPCSFTLKLQFYYSKIKLIIARAPQFKKGNESL